MSYRGAWRWANVIGLVVVLAVGFTACGGEDSGSGGGAGSETTPDGTPAEGAGTGGSAGDLRVATSAVPATIDPASVTGVNDAMSMNFYVRLTQVGWKDGPDGMPIQDPTKIEPYLAESWDISKDRKTLTFTLTPGLKFASGAPVDSEAVKFSFDRTLDFPANYALNNGVSDNIKSVTAPSPTTVVIKLNQPDPNALKAYASYAGSIMDPTVVGKEDKEWLATHEAGSGPFELESYQPGTRIVMKARPDYAKWSGKSPKSETITVDLGQDDSTLLLNARSGKTDVTEGLSKHSAKTLKDSGAKVIENDTIMSEEVLLSWDYPPFANPKVREALTYAVPVDAIVNQVAEGMGKPFYGPFPSTLLPDGDASLREPLGTDLERAKAAMRESGVETPLPVTFTILQGNTLQEQAATILQSAWRDLDVDVKIEKLSAADYADKLFNQKKFQATIREDGPGVVDLGYYLGYNMRCSRAGLGPNIPHICIPQADKLLDEARLDDDVAANTERYDEITKLWREKFPKIPLYNDVQATVLSPAVTSFSVTTLPLIDMSDWGASSEE